MPVASTMLIYALAAVAEIAGCFAVWGWLRLNASAFWLIPGAIALLGALVCCIGALIILYGPRTA